MSARPALETRELAALLHTAGLALGADADVAITGRDPILASRFRVGEAAAAALVLGGDAAARLHALRGHPPQRVSVDVGAAAASLLGFVLQRATSGFDLARHASPVTALYEAGDGRFVHLHGGFPHLAEGLLELLGCEAEAASLAAAVRRWKAFDLEDAIAERGLCGAAVRTAAEWAAHPQGAAVAGLPAALVERIGDAPPEPLADAPRPLGGVRVLDLTRVLAGPTCGRTLASHGADVLRVGAERLPSIEPFVVDTGRGKRNAFLDLERPDDRERLRTLARDADVFTQGYRPGALARRGFGPDQLAALRPGIVYVDVGCYGSRGPWAERAGWEQLAQTVTGIAAAEGGDGPPRLIPAAATDYTTGYLAAYGAMEALRRRATEGGSWHVRTSLVQTGMWLVRLGDDVDPAAAAGLGGVADLVATCETAWGELTHLVSPVAMDGTPPYWERPPAPLGSCEPAWLPRAGA